MRSPSPSSLRDATSPKGRGKSTPGSFLIALKTSATSLTAWLSLRGKTSPAPGEDVAQRQKGESGAGAPERACSLWERWHGVSRDGEGARRCPMVKVSRATKNSVATAEAFTRRGKLSLKQGAAARHPVQQPLVFIQKIDQLSCEGSAFGVTLARDNAVLPACACFTRLSHAVSVPP